MPHSAFHYGDQFTFSCSAYANDLRSAYADLSLVRVVFAACRMASQAEEVINTESAESELTVLYLPSLGLNLTDLLKTDASDKSDEWGVVCCARQNAHNNTSISLNDDLCGRFYFCVFMDWFRFRHFSMDVICNT